MTTLDAFFTDLARHGVAPVEAWPAAEDLESYGLVVEAGRVVPAVAYDPLVPEQIRQALSRRAARWLRSLEVHPVIGSTNAELVGLAERQSIDGWVSTAELQLAGRGRRGRSWSSPFGANLAISIGMAVDRPVAALGGLSLVVGLAVLDALESLDLRGLSLKWPNDVLLGDAKLGGILIEMTRRATTEVVIGVGLNITLPEPVRAALPPGVADLSQLGPPPSRSVLAAGIVSSVFELVREFERAGFVPFKPAFDLRHHFHGRACRIFQDGDSIHGSVIGVADNGELILETAEGSRSFPGGEVSLRPET